MAEVIVKIDLKSNRIIKLQMTHIHAMINIDIEEVINKFSKRKNRKLEFLI